MKKPVKKIAPVVPEPLSAVEFRREMAALKAIIPGTKEYADRVEAERLTKEKHDAGQNA